VFAYDGDNLIEETNAAGAVVARYSQGLNIDEPLAMLRSSATSFYHADGLGSITSLANAAGALAQTYTFDSFGKQTALAGSLTNSFQYTSREFDSETNLQFSRARYYDAANGRFMSEDPIRFAGDGANFYGYVSNNPVNFVDPSGLLAELICEPIASTRGGWKYAPAMLLSRAHHCFIHVKCNDYDVTIELYGPSPQDPKHGIPHMDSFNPQRGRIRRPIKFPSGYKCCQNEDLLLDAFRRESLNIPVYNGRPGPNSNTFVFKIISEAAGDVEFPNQAYGWDYVP
jgi:RHS repeat-associated protein